MSETSQQLLGIFTLINDIQSKIKVKSKATFSADESRVALTIEAPLKNKTIRYSWSFSRDELRTMVIGLTAHRIERICLEFNQFYRRSKVREHQQSQVNNVFPIQDPR